MCVCGGGGFALKAAALLSMGICCLGPWSPARGGRADLTSSGLVHLDEPMTQEFGTDADPLGAHTSVVEIDRHPFFLPSPDLYAHRYGHALACPMLHVRTPWPRDGTPAGRQGPQRHHECEQLEEGLPEQRPHERDSEAVGRHRDGMPFFVEGGRRGQRAQGLQRGTAAAQPAATHDHRGIQPLVSATEGRRLGFRLSIPFHCTGAPLVLDPPCHASNLRWHGPSPHKQFGAAHATLLRASRLGRLD